MSATTAIIDDLSREPPIATIGSNWQLLTDQVMGGVSKGTLVRAAVAGRPAIRMLGDVSLENNGGFIQIALDLSPDGGVVDASAWGGIELDVFGNGEEYGVHLRTDALTRPWQSYRQTFKADAKWRTVQLPFDHFVPHPGLSRDHRAPSSGDRRSVGELAAARYRRRTLCLRWRH